MRSTSPSKSDYTLSKFPAHKIRNMNKDEYYHQRNIVMDRNIPKNSINYPDNENPKSQSPGLNLKQSNMHSSLKQSQNYEHMYM